MARDGVGFGVRRGGQVKGVTLAEKIAELTARAELYATQSLAGETPWVDANAAAIVAIDVEGVSPHAIATRAYEAALLDWACAKIAHGFAAGYAAALDEGPQLRRTVRK